MNEYNPSMGFLSAEYKARQYFTRSIWRGKEFCHYTNLHGLLGIIQNSEIWLSDYRFLNDKLEYLYGQQIALNAIHEYRSKLQESPFASLVETVQSKIQENTDRSYFLASFCKVKDSLDQWKGYGADGESVCLVFENDSFLGRDAVLVQGPHVSAFEVIYDPQELYNSIIGILKVFAKEYSVTPEKELQLFSTQWLASIIWMIEQQFIIYKHPSYSSEQEVRLLTTGKLLNNLKTIKHRVSKGRIIPYISTQYLSNVQSRQLPLKEIIVVPIATQDTIVASIKNFLFNSGYTSIPVNASTLPFRG